MEVLENHSKIPDGIKEHCRRSISKKIRHPLLQGIVDIGPGIIEKLAVVISQASENMGIGIQDLMSQAHFNPRDASGVRFDSFVAELRSVNYFHGIGFTNITFIPEQSEARPDLLAEYKSKIFSIEVATAGRHVIRVPTTHGTATLQKQDGSELKVYHGDPHSLIGYFTEIYKVKNSQLCWSPRGVVATPILAFVLNNYHTYGLCTRDDYIDTLIELHSNAANGLVVHFAVITGMIDGCSGIPDECIWPLLPGTH